jgi:hypothetical protein
MTTLRKTKYIHEGPFVAEVDVELLDDDTSWAPYLSISDAERLDAVRANLRRGDLKAASSQARVYTLQPVAVPK